MADTTNIEWCDSTFNPWIGCTRVGTACDDCYAARSTPARTLGVAWGAGEQRHRTSKANWEKPEQWQRQAAAFHASHGRRRRVFCASLADVFDNEVPQIWRAELFSLIKATPDLDWLLLTKRIGNAWKMMADACGVSQASLTLPLHNVWLGATVVNQEEADRDIVKLLRVPAVVRFLSVEPMLGPLDLTWCKGEPFKDVTGKTRHHALNALGSHGLGGIDWVICGGESGPKARPMHPDWARSLRDQCAAAGVPFNFKQHGEWVEVDGDKPTRTVHVESDIGETLASKCDGFISLAGEFVLSMDDATTDDPYRGLVRDGKKAAGRLLDGSTHDGFPRGAL